MSFQELDERYLLYSFPSAATSRTSQLGGVKNIGSEVRSQLPQKSSGAQRPAAKTTVGSSRHDFSSEVTVLHSQ